MTKLPLVVVEWGDAWSDATEPINLADAHAHHRPKVIVTLGYLLLEDAEGVSLANEYYKDEDTYRGRTFIPGAMIIHVKPYKLTKPRAPRVKTTTTPKEEGTV